MSHEILKKGSIDITDCTIVLAQNTPVRGKEWVFRIVSPSQVNPIVIAAPSEEEMNDWVQKIRETTLPVYEKVTTLYMFIYLYWHYTNTCTCTCTQIN